MAVKAKLQSALPVILADDFQIRPVGHVDAGQYWMQCDVMSGAVLDDIRRHVRRDGCVSDWHSLHVECRDVRRAGHTTHHVMDTST